MIKVQKPNIYFFHNWASSIFHYYCLYSTEKETFTQTLNCHFFVLKDTNSTEKAKPKSSFFRFLLASALIKLRSVLSVHLRVWRVSAALGRGASLPHPLPRAVPRLVRGRQASRLHHWLTVGPGASHHSECEHVHRPTHTHTGKEQKD